jgi:hypothetical protein
MLLKHKSLYGKYRKEYLKLFSVNPEDYGNITFYEFIREVNDIAKSIKFSNDPKIDEDTRNTFKGDALEIFAEVYFKSSGISTTYGISDYTIIDVSEDYGVDAKGKNANGKDTIIQIKYRVNPAEVIPYEEISKTVASGHLQYQFDLRHPGTIILFSSTYEESYHARNVLGSSFTFIGRRTIEDGPNGVNNNVNFWKILSESVFETINSSMESSPINE